jgi:hypothetical protein
MVGEFFALVPGEGPCKLVRERYDVLSNALGNVGCSSVVDTDQYPGASRALNKGRNSRVASFADDEVALPVARDGTVGDLCGAV